MLDRGSAGLAPLLAGPGWAINAPVRTAEFSLGGRASYRSRTPSKRCAQVSGLRSSPPLRANSCLRP
jgi:hypothetical protein